MLGAVCSGVLVSAPASWSLAMAQSSPPAFVCQLGDCGWPKPPGFGVLQREQPLEHRRLRPLVLTGLGNACNARHGVQIS